MPALLLYVSGAFLLASTVLGYLNFTRLKEKNARLADREQTITQRTSELAATKKDLKGKEADLVAGKKENDELKAGLASAKSESERLGAQIGDFQAQLTAKQNELEELRKAAPPPGLAGSPAPAPETERRIAELSAQVAELSQVKASLDDKLAAAEGRARSLQAAEVRRQQGVAARGLSGEVLAVNPSWNFVVLSLGDRQGVTANAEMVVMRRGTMVGRVRITSVEPSQSIADIVPASVPPGFAVQPGDRVIYPGG